MERKILCLLIVSVFFLSSLTTISARNLNSLSLDTIYIDGDAGCDETGDGSEQHPYKTIQKGIDVANKGDSVYVYSGNYDKIKIDKSITLQGENKDTTIIDGNRARFVVDITADEVHFTGFRVINGWIGIFVNSSSYCVLSGNDVMYNSHNLDGYKFGYGIYLDGDVKSNCSNNIVKENNITNNRAGLFVAWATDNKIYHNNFKDNEAFNAGTNSLMTDYPNQWDNGYPSGGNYWDNYPGSDNCHGKFQILPGSDGIGDSGFRFDFFSSNNSDYYPLMQPYSEGLKVKNKIVSNFFVDAIENFFSRIDFSFPIISKVLLTDNY